MTINSFLCVLASCGRSSGFRLSAAALSRSSEMRIFGSIVCAGGKFARLILAADFAFTANMRSAELTEAVAKPRMSSLRDQHTRRYNRSMGRYGLVDFAAHYQKGFRNHVVPVTDAPALM